ncbi:hypothetical protein TRFO_26276 [Tritrichomonas foetus]|uniref:Uncharacterized protein n=1 Tax=Tritrichomonas foetus TaxID=1144522 RepID=A0A1J4K4F5_9EUKA|nr:hypothetical protein TRFO_26276 [Tritrichomonas foetus]|eukprot:OHT05850.1 hypothetical protein TRFO_26276 [Tritrichomonas foetus]
MTLFSFKSGEYDDQLPDFCLKINDKKFNCSKSFLSSVSETVQKFVSKSRSHGCSCRIQDIPTGSDWSLLTRLLRNEEIEINNGNSRFLHKVAKSLHINSLEEATVPYLNRSRGSPNKSGNSNSRQNLNSYESKPESPLRTPSGSSPSKSPLKPSIKSPLNNSPYDRTNSPYDRTNSPYDRTNSPYNENLPYLKEEDRENLGGSTNANNLNAQNNRTPPKTMFNLNLKFEDLNQNRRKEKEVDLIPNSARSAQPNRRNSPKSPTSQRSSSRNNSRSPKSSRRTNVSFDLDDHVRRSPPKRSSRSMYDGEDNNISNDSPRRSSHRSSHKSSQYNKNQRYNELNEENENKYDNKENRYDNKYDKKYDEDKFDNKYEDKKYDDHSDEEQEINHIDYNENEVADDEDEPSEKPHKPFRPYTYDYDRNHEKTSYQDRENPEKYQERDRQKENEKEKRIEKSNKNDDNHHHRRSGRNSSPKHESPSRNEDKHRNSSSRHRQNKDNSPSRRNPNSSHHNSKSPKDHKERSNSRSNMNTSTSNPSPSRHHHQNHRSTSPNQPNRSSKENQNPQQNNNDKPTLNYNNLQKKPHVVFEEEEEIDEIRDEELNLEKLDPEYDNIDSLRELESSMMKLSSSSVSNVLQFCLNILPCVSLQTICRSILFCYAVRPSQAESYFILTQRLEKRINHPLFFQTMNSILDRPPPEFENEFKFFQTCLQEDRLLRIPSVKNQLLAAIRHDDIATVKALTSESNFDFNKEISDAEKDKEFRTFVTIHPSTTLLEYSALYASYQVFKYLHSKGSNMTDNIPLFAVAGGNFEIVKFCEEECCLFDDTPILAVKFHRWDIFEWLVDKQLEDYTHQHIFEVCLQFSNFKTLLKIVKRKKGKSEKMLMKATKYDNFLLYKFLFKQDDKEQLKRKFTMIKQPNGGFLPIHYAVLNQNIRFVKFLIENSPEQVNDYTTRDKFEPKKDPRLLAPIHFACKVGNLLIVRLLLQSKRVNVNEGAKGINKTPLHYAAKHGHLDIVEYLLKKRKVDVNCQTTDRLLTPLHFACMKGNVDVVKALLNKRGIKPNLRNKDSRTPQQLTANQEIIRLFK